MFGKRGALEGVEHGLVAAPVPSSTQLPSQEGEGFRRLLARPALFVILLLVLVAGLEPLLSSTSLLTPIDQNLLILMRGIGAGMGLILGIAMLFVPVAPEATALLRLGPGKKLLTVAFMPLMIGFLFDGLAWRIADWREFGLSNQPFTPALHPVEYFNDARKGSDPVAEIDPFGTKRMTEIPITPAQYDQFWLSREPLCIEVLQRRTPSGAVQVKTNGAFNWAEPKEARIERCPEGVTSRVWKRNADYAAKKAARMRP